MGHWEHRWGHETEWIKTEGKLSQAKSLKDANEIMNLSLECIGHQMWLSRSSDIQIRYIGILDEFTHIPMESPSFSLEEIELAQKMIGQK